MITQEVFTFHKKANLDWSSFIDDDSNSEAMRALVFCETWPNNGLILHGDSGVGKTHVMSLWAQSYNAIYVLPYSVQYHPRLLFENDCNFVFDNFDNFLTLDCFEWMFNFFNLSNECNRKFILVSRMHPTNWTILLNDLKSRLDTLLVAYIRQPSDTLLMNIIKKISKDYNIFVSDEIIEYLLIVKERKVHIIVDILLILDKLSLRFKKPISMNFLKRYIF